MLGKLPVMNRPRDISIEESKLSHRDSARQDGQNIAILTHNLLRSRHGFGEIGIVRRQRESARRLTQKNLIPLPHPQARKHVLGQNYAGGVSDLDELERLVHTNVLTYFPVTAKFRFATNNSKTGYGAGSPDMSLDAETFDALIDTVRRFVAERLRPLEAEVEEADSIPAHIVEEMKALGLFGLSIAEEFGGLGLTMLEECRVALELGRTTPAFRSTFGTNVGIGSQGLVMAGTPEQKAVFLK